MNTQLVRPVCDTTMSPLSFELLLSLQTEFENARGYKCWIRWIDVRPHKWPKAIRAMAVMQKTLLACQLNRPVTSVMMLTGCSKSISLESSTCSDMCQRSLPFLTSFVQIFVSTRGKSSFIGVLFSLRLALNHKNTSTSIHLEDVNPSVARTLSVEQKLTGQPSTSSNNLLKPDNIPWNLAPGDIETMRNKSPSISNIAGNLVSDLRLLLGNLSHFFIRRNGD